MTFYVSVIGYHSSWYQQWYAEPEWAEMTDAAAETATLETGEAAETAPEAATTAKRTVALESGEAAETALEVAEIGRAHV